MLEKFRGKAREDAVCVQGTSYARRPMTMEKELWKKNPDSHISMLGEDEGRRSSGSGGGGGGTRSNKDKEGPYVESEGARIARHQEEAERARRLHDIYAKYGSASQTRAG